MCTPPAPPGVSLPLIKRKKTPVKGKKTPGGAGTHTGRTRDTRAHKGTRITGTSSWEGKVFLWCSERDLSSYLNSLTSV